MTLKIINSNLIYLHNQTNSLNIHTIVTNVSLFTDKSIGFKNEIQIDIHYLMARRCF